MLQEPKYSKTQVHNAGKKIIKKDISIETRNRCLQIIDNWRASHAYPMHSIAATLKTKSKKYKNVIIAQRLKRLDTILDKLGRYPEMSLSRMQDIGGCRVIFNSLHELKLFRKALMRTKMKHNLSNEKNYIKSPKPDTGYRGIHLIYKYSSEKTPQYNDLLIEVQLRTKLQHLWATAVETVGMFTRNPLKFNQGDDVWLRFFKLVSIIFAAEEEQKTFKSISKIKKHSAVMNELLELIKKYNLFGKLHSFAIINPILNRSNKTKSGYYLLNLNVQKKILNAQWYKETDKDFNLAITEYTKLESSKEENEDVVLVAVKNIRTLMKAYPNYFSDISEFNHCLMKYMDNQLKKCEKFLRENIFNMKNVLLSQNNENSV